MSELVETKEEDVLNLIENIREDDFKEIIASHGPDIATTIYSTFDNSYEAFSGFNKDGELLGITGVINTCLFNSEATPWLLTTKALDKNPRVLLRHTKDVIKHWLEDWEVLSNYIDSRYTKALRWAEWSGFTIFPAVPYGAHQLTFHRIEIRRS